METLFHRHLEHFPITVKRMACGNGCFFFVKKPLLYSHCICIKHYSSQYLLHNLNSSHRNICTKVMISLWSHSHMRLHMNEICSQSAQLWTMKPSYLSWCCCCSVQLVCVLSTHILLYLLYSAALAVLLKLSFCTLMLSFSCTAIGTLCHPVYRPPVLSCMLHCSVKYTLLKV